MALMIGWLTGEDQIKCLLQESHRSRHNAGREETKRRIAEVERLRRSGDERRAAALDEREWKKGIAFMRRKRRQEEIEEKLGKRRFRAAINAGDRLTTVRACPAQLFQQFEPITRAGEKGLRNLHYDVISRGLRSGWTKDYKRHLKRSSSRTTRWKAGEMGRKVQYIVRSDALEQVAGNVSTNMGDTIEEAIACTRVIEQIERLSRPNAGVYKHVIVGLPHHLSPSERAALLVEMTTPLREMGLPFVASLHRPDPKGDQRNYHAHLIVSLRPMERLGDHQWEFEAAKRTWLDTPAALRLQRRTIAAMFNHALANADETVRWTGKSLASRGNKSPGNNKQSQAANRACREQAGADEDLKVALENVSALEGIARDLSSLHSAVGSLGKASYKFDKVAKQALTELTALRVQTAEQVASLEHLVTVHDSLGAAISTVPVDAARSCETNCSAPDPSNIASLQDRDGGSRRTMAKANEQSSPVEPADEVKTIGPDDAFAETRRFELEEDRRTGSRASPAPTKLKPFMTSFELVEAGAKFEMSETWDRVDDEAFANVSRALRSDPPTLTARPAENGDYQLFATSAATLKDVGRMCQSDAGKLYFRLVLEEAPRPPADVSNLKTAFLRRQGKAEAQSSPMPGTLPQVTGVPAVEAVGQIPLSQKNRGSAPAITPAQPLGVSIDQQAEFLALRKEKGR